MTSGLGVKSPQKKMTKGQQWFASLSEEEKIKYREKKKLEQESLSGKLNDCNEKVNALFSDIASMSEEEYEAIMNRMIKFRRYSIRNNLLLYVQKPDVDQVGSKSFWFSQGYKLKKGAESLNVCVPVEKIVFSKDIDEKTYQKGLQSELGRIDIKKQLGIWTPLHYNNFIKDKDGSHKIIVKKFTAEFNNFGKVYDSTEVEEYVKDGVSQARPFREFTTSSDVSLSDLKKYVKEEFCITTKEVESGVATGGFVTVGNAKVININPRQTDLENTGSLIHELSHILLGHTDEDHKKADPGSEEFQIDYAVDEVQAETLAYLIRGTLGIETESKGYIKGYMGFLAISELGPTSLKKQMDEVIKTFDKNKKHLNEILKKIQDT